MFTPPPHRNPQLERNVLVMGSIKKNKTAVIIFRVLKEDFSASNIAGEDVSQIKISFLILFKFSFSICLLQKCEGQLLTSQGVFGGTNYSNYSATCFRCSGKS